MIFTDTLGNYFNSTYDAIEDYCRIQQGIDEKEQFWLDDYINPALINAKQNVSIVFEKEYKALCKSKEYFYLCPIGVYRYTYRTCLTNSGVDEVTFISNKLQTLLNDDSPGSYLNPLNKSILKENRINQIEYLQAVLAQKYRLNYVYNDGEFGLIKMDSIQLESSLEKIPDVFISQESYICFLNLSSDYIEGKIQDTSPISFWSYIKACLVEQRILRPLSNKDYVVLLNQHKVLSDEVYDRLLGLNCKLYTKAKSVTEQRTRVFNTYFV